MIVTEDQVSDAVLYLTTSSGQVAAAIATRYRAEQRRKRVRSKCILGSSQPTVLLKEAEAEASDDYADACEAEARAIQTVEQCRADRATAEAIIEVWRTLNANARAAERLR